MSLFSWSQTASSNSNADASINWAEGQAPSSVNDSARAMMAATAKWRDDIAGAIVTTGTSTAYLVSSFSSFDSFAHLNGQVIAFSPHTTNGATVTLNVDSLGAKPLRTAPNVELLAGTIVQGTPYLALYNNSDGAFYLHGFFGNNPYNIPLGAGIDFWAPTLPNSNFGFPIGQAVSRAVYASLFALIGTTYGVGDGSTTFNLPDKRGRVSATPDTMGGGGDANRLTSSPSIAGTRNSLGGAGGLSGNTLTAANLPPITSTNPSQAISVTSTSSSIPTSFASPSVSSGPFPETTIASASSVVSTGNNSISVTSTGTTNTTVENSPPTILCNYIMRII